MTKSCYCGLCVALTSLCFLLLDVVGACLYIAPDLPMLHFNLRMMAMMVALAVICLFGLFYLAAMCPIWMESPVWKSHPDWHGVPRHKFKQGAYNLKKIGHGHDQDHGHD